MKTLRIVLVSTVTFGRLVLAGTSPVCVVVPSSSTGVAVGLVNQGQVVTYEASGLIGFNADGCRADPDGNVTSPCEPAIGDDLFLCPGLQAFSLVAKISNGSCIQLGSSGSFTAPTSGGLTMYMNDSSYGDNGGSWSACVTGVIPPPPLGCAPVSATSPTGTSFGNVTAGRVYAYSATGFIGFNFDGCLSDADGNVTSPCHRAKADRLFICPGRQAFSLVGKVGDGDCLQFGSEGRLRPSASGELVLAVNDSVYDDNSGAWDVCVALVVPLDIAPRTCPNKLARQPGLISVTICGTPSLPAGQIDTKSLKLAGLAPTSTALADLNAPSKRLPLRLKHHRCSRRGSDGVVDLVLEFDQIALFDALGTVTPGDVHVLRLTGALLDGTPIVGEDVVIIQ